MYVIRTARAVYEVEYDGLTSDNGEVYTSREFTKCERTIFAFLAAVAKSATTDADEESRVDAIGRWLDTLPRL